MKKDHTFRFRVPSADRDEAKDLAAQLGVKESVFLRTGLELAKAAARETLDATARQVKSQSRATAERAVHGLEPSTLLEHRQQQLAEQAASRIPPGTDERDETQPWLTPRAERERGGKYTYYSPRPRPLSYGQRAAAGYLSLGRRPQRPDESLFVQPHTFHPTDERNHR